MSSFLKKIFGTIIEKPWEAERAQVDDAHSGQTFDLSVQKSAVIIIFGIATVLFSLIFTGYIYSVPPEQDTKYLLKPNLLWINTFILFVISFYFNKTTNELKKTTLIFGLYFKSKLIFFPSSPLASPDGNALTPPTPPKVNFSELSKFFEACCREP